MGDPFSSNAATPQSFGTKGRVITPANVDLATTAKGIICLTAGNITILPVGNEVGENLAFVEVPAGFVPPYRVRRVTSATAIVATIDD